MIKIIGYFFLGLTLLLVVTITAGSIYFNNSWFKEKPNYLTFSSEPKPIDFQWAEEKYDDHVEPHNAILIPVKINGMAHKFYFQFDTGAPSTLIYGNTLKSLINYGLDAKEIEKEEKKFIENINFNLGGNHINAAMIEILPDYGKAFEPTDTIKGIKIGSIGADFMDQQITLIDFKNQFIRLYKQRPKWMSSLSGFEPFDFKGRRFMLPSKIGNKKLELFYDSGSSAFGLITSKHRYKKYSNKNIEEIKYGANSWGNTLNICHKATDEMMEIGGAGLELQRISYVDMYANLQRFITPFTKIGGWLGNKPFTESTLILDTKAQEFIVVESSVENRNRP